MSSKPSSKAQSRYRQFRVTATQEVSGRVSYSVYAKPLDADWTGHQCIIRGSTDAMSSLESSEDVVLMLLIVLESYVLPSVARPRT